MIAGLKVLCCGSWPTAAERQSSDRAVDTAASASADDHRRLLWALLDAEVTDAVHALPAALRQAVWLRDVEGFSYAAIATILKIPLDTVVSRISRGRRLLSADLRERGRVEAGRYGFSRSDPDTGFD